MRIDGYGLNQTPPLPGANRKPVAPQDTHAQTSRESAPSYESIAAEMSPQEKFPRLIEEKRTMADAAFNESAAPAELGKHIDLRV